MTSCFCQLLFMIAWMPAAHAVAPEGGAVADEPVESQRDEHNVRLTDSGPMGMSVFTGAVQRLTAADREQMMNVSWRAGCPTPMEELRRVTFSRWTSEGTQGSGEIIVASSAARDVLSVFQALFEVGFPVHSAERVDVYGGDDDASMAANNTSGFNCRKVGGSERWSEHASGLALDINPLQNPMVTGRGVYPPAGRDWLDRGNVRPGMVTDGDWVVRAFSAIGWRWGGHWTSLKDYQHFSRSGR